MADELPIPKSRTESYLAKAAGEDVTIPDEPRSRLEQYLNAIAENGGGGGGGTNNFNQLTNRPKYNGTTMTGSTNIPEVKSYSAGTGLKLTGTAFSVDTTTIQPKLTAGSNVTISDNTISATDTTYSNFTGTDGTSAGVAGLVPAPATTDAGKFLKADGTWDTAGGGSGGVAELTSADYNWNSTAGSATEPYDSVAIWLLDDGLYRYGSGVSIKVNKNTSIDNEGGAILVTSEVIGSDNVKGWDSFEPGLSSMRMGSTYKMSGNAYAPTETVLKSSNIVQTTGVSSTSAMSQNAVTSMVFADPATQYKIKIGAGTSTSEGANAIEIGRGANSSGTQAVALGYNTMAKGAYNVAIGGGSGHNSTTYEGTIALGSGSGGNITASGMADIGTYDTSRGYNSSNYRLLTGLYDPQSAHDAATKGYVDTAVAGASYDPTISNNTLYL